MLVVWYVFVYAIRWHSIIGNIFEWVFDKFGKRGDTGIIGCSLHVQIARMLTWTTNRNKVIFYYWERATYMQSNFRSKKDFSGCIAKWRFSEKQRILKINNQRANRFFKIHNNVYLIGKIFKHRTHTWGKFGPFICTNWSCGNFKISTARQIAETSRTHVQVRQIVNFSI